MTVNVVARVHKRPKLSRPVLLGGIPDSGYITKLIMDHLVKELKAEEFAEIYSSAYPPRIRVREDGTADLPKNRFYFWTNPAGQDLILFTGDSQPTSPEGAYEICGKVLELAKELGVKRVYTIGAGIGNVYDPDPKVYGTASEKNLVEELRNLGVNVMTRGTITWMNGLLIGLAKLMDMEGIFICAYCYSGDSAYEVDAKAAQGLVDSLSKVFGFHVDLAPLQERVRETWTIIHSEDRTQTEEEVKPGKPGIYG